MMSRDGREEKDGFGGQRTQGTQADDVVRVGAPREGPEWPRKALERAAFLVESFQVTLTLLSPHLSKKKIDTRLN